MTATLSTAEWRALAASGDLVALAKPVKTQPTGEFLVEPKFDGWRLVAIVGGDRTHLYARSGQSLTGKLPAVEAELFERFPAGTVLDGEAVALRVQDGKILNEWSIAQNVLSTAGAHIAAPRITFMVFDLLAHAHIDARALPLRGRRKLLDRIFAAESFQKVQLSPAVVASGEELASYHAAHMAQGFEGTMLKRLDGTYRSGARDWSKLKPQQTREVVVMGFKPGQGGFKGLVGAVEFGEYNAAGKLVYIGRCSGMDMRTRRHMTAHPEEWVGKVIEVAHFDPAKKGGRARSPQFRRIRPDRAPVTIRSGG